MSPRTRRRIAFFRAVWEMKRRIQRGNGGHVLQVCISRYKYFGHLQKGKPLLHSEQRNHQSLLCLFTTRVVPILCIMYQPYLNFLYKFPVTKTRNTRSFYLAHIVVNAGISHQQGILSCLLIQGPRHLHMIIPSLKTSISKRRKKV